MRTITLEELEAEIATTAHDLATLRAQLAVLLGGGTLRERVLTALSGGLSLPIREIANVTRDSTEAVWMTISKLCAAGEIERTARGFYRLRVHTAKIQ